MSDSCQIFQDTQRLFTHSGQLECPGFLTDLSNYNKIRLLVAILTGGEVVDIKQIEYLDKV